MYISSESKKSNILVSDLHPPGCQGMSNHVNWSGKTLYVSTRRPDCYKTNVLLVPCCLNLLPPHKKNVHSTDTHSSTSYLGSKDNELQYTFYFKR